LLPVLSSPPSISPRNTSNSATSTQRADEPKGFVLAVAKDEGMKEEVADGSVTGDNAGVGGNGDAVLPHYKESPKIEWSEE
jgi:hypothetical protein